MNLKGEMVFARWALGWGCLFVFLIGVPGGWAYRAEVENISARDYFETVRREVGRAKSSVSLTLYLFSLSPREPSSKTFQLAEALSAAQARGVRVSVLLDRSAPSYAGGETEGVNQAAFAFLKARGVPVFWDREGTLTHAKVLIIDEETVILGSSNWTRAALELNEEVNVMVRSRGLARDLLTGLNALPRESPPEEPTVLIPAAYLAGGVLSRMAQGADERALDVLLYFLWRGETSFRLDSRALAEHLGLGGLSENASRRQIHKTLKKLKDRYGVLDLTLHHGGAADVVLRLPDRPEEPGVPVPVAYWSRGWNRRLSLAGKFFFLINCRERAVSDFPPRWSASLARLGERYGVSPWFVTRGVTELRRKNVVEVEYDPVGWTGPLDPRRPNVYFLNPLPDFEAAERRLSELEKRFGVEKVARARKAAALVYEDGDVDGVQKLIALEERFGRDRIAAAEKILGAKRPDNPKRSLGYLIRTVQELADID